MLQFNQDCKALVINNTVFTVDDVSSVLKRFLRGLPESLYTRELDAKFLALPGIENYNDKFCQLQLLLEKLPNRNFQTLKRTFQHLNKVANHENENKMGIHNLATVIGPNIRGEKMQSDMMSTKQLLAETQKEVSFLL